MNNLYTLKIVSRESFLSPSYNSGGARGALIRNDMQSNSPVNGCANKNSFSQTISSSTHTLTHSLFECSLFITNGDWLLRMDAYT